MSPHATPKHSLAQLTFNCNLRTRLDLLKPDEQRLVNQKQLQDSAKNYHPYTNNEIVMAPNYRPKTKRMPETIVENTGPVSYKVAMSGGGTIWQRHADQLQPGRQVLLDPSSESIVPLTNTTSGSGDYFGVPPMTTNSVPVITHPPATTAVREEPEEQPGGGPLESLQDQVIL